MNLGSISTQLEKKTLAEYSLLILSFAHLFAPSVLPSTLLSHTPPPPSHALCHAPFTPSPSFLSW